MSNVHVNKEEVSSRVSEVLSSIGRCKVSIQADYGAIKGIADSKGAVAPEIATLISKEKAMVEEMLDTLAQLAATMKTQANELSHLDVALARGMNAKQ
jgi:hypothetical protein